VAAVVVATGIRVARAENPPVGVRAPALVLSVLTPLGLAVFALAGPLAHGWARRAGTPVKLLGHPAPVRVAQRTSPAPASGSGSVSVSPFTANISGTVRQSQAPGGAIVDLDLHLSGGERGRLRVRLAGQPSPGGGLSMTGSQVDLLIPSTGVMAGQITSLQGTEFTARVVGSGGRLNVHARLNIDSQTNVVSGSVAASPVGGGR
jgi:hypothetical protein